MLVPTHVLLIAKHPLVMLKPTLAVVVADAEMFNPETVVVPKPIDETDNCVAVDEPTTNPMVSPASGLTDKRPFGDVVPTPNKPAAVMVVVALLPNAA